MPKYPKIKVKLTGQDSNAFMLIGLVQRGLRKGKVPEDQVAAFRKEAMSGGYDNVLQTCCKWVNVS